jgi:NinB protein
MINPQQAHQVLAQSVWPGIKSLTMAGHEVLVQFGIREDDRSLQQNRFYWGAVLKEISQQASICGVSYAPEAWHELFRRQFLGYEVEKIQVAGHKRKQVIRRLKSTTKLKIRAMSKYLDQVQAYAASELGVQFSAPNWMEWAERQHATQCIDPDTGEITDAE